MNHYISSVTIKNGSGQYYNSFMGRTSENNIWPM